MPYTDLLAIRLSFLGAFLGLSLSLSGCATTNVGAGVAPQDSNIFQAGVNLSTGEYDRQLERKRLELERTQQTETNVEKENKRLEYEVDYQRDNLQSLQDQVAWLKQENEQIAQSIEQQKAQTQAQQKQKAETLAKVERIRAEIRALEKTQQYMQNEDYQRRIQLLSAEVRALRSLASKQ